MAITLDPTTQAAYLVGTTLAARASAVVSAFSGTVTVKIFDGTDAERASGTFAGVWASSTAGTITVGEVVSLTVSSGGTPDDDWYVLFEDADSWIRGSFGLVGSGKDFTWSGATFETGQTADLGTITFTASDPSPLSAPSNTSAPVISGTATVGELLTASSGTWSGTPAPTFAYQWLRNNVNISGATASAYTLTEADDGALIVCRVTATNSQGSASALSAAVGPIAAAVDALSISGVPASITLYQESTYDLSQHVSGGYLPYTYDIASGTLPTGVTLDASTGILSASVSATVAVSGALTFGVTDSEPALEVGSFTLSSSNTGVLPFAVAIPLADGAVSSTDTLTLSGASGSVTFKRNWNSGYRKQAIIRGYYTSTGAAQVVSVLKGSGTSGTALTEAAVISAGPGCLVNLGAYGSVSLGSLMGTSALKSTWLSTPQCIELRYYWQSSNADLGVWIYVDHWSDGRTRIRAIGRNSHIPRSQGADLTYALTVTIGSSTALSIASHTHYRGTDWVAEGWIGGDPAVHVAHDFDYLVDSKLVPNYYRPATPSESILNGLATTYTPNAAGPYPTGMTSGGAQPHIGLLPRWQALWITSGDTRARQASEASSKFIRNRPMCWVDPTTLKAIRPSDWSTWSINGSHPAGGVSYHSTTASTSLTWGVTHAPSEGYLQYLLTGDDFHLESMALAVGAHYLLYRTTFGFGTSRIFPMSFREAERGTAWGIRNLATYCAIAPSDDALLSDYQEWLANNIAYMAGQAASPTASPLGVLYVANLAEVNAFPYGGNGYAPWMHGFMVSALGFGKDLEPLSSMAEWDALLTYVYKHPVGLFGESGNVDEYSFSYSGQEIIVLSPSNTLDSSEWYSTWGQVYQAERGVPNNVVHTALDIYSNAGVSVNIGPTSYHANAMPSLAYAVDHGASGASAAWSRLSGATNFSTLTSGMENSPQFAIVPRSWA